MKTILGFNPGGLLLAAFFAGLGFGGHATADPFHRAYLIDLNSRTATDLGTLGGSSYGFGINDAGQVVGYADLYAVPLTIEVPSRAFITGLDGMGMRDLGSLGGKFNVARGINEAGQVVGYSYTAEQNAHAFITGPNGEGMRDLGTLGGRVSFGYGINDAGRVVGVTSVPDPPGASHAFITGPDGEGMRDLGSRTAFDINVAGQVVGSFGAGFRSSHAFITGADGTGMRDLGTLGGYNSMPWGINDAGQVVGSSTRFFNSSQRHAFITGPDGTGMRDLGTLGGHDSVALGINNAGQVVGTSSIGGIFQDQHAFVTGTDGRMIDLNSLVDLPAGTVLTEARGINNVGQVIANAAVIPEPESYALLLAGLIVIGGVAGRRKDIGTLPAPS
jgi:probable HAF family extracellular repeat protein